MTVFGFGYFAIKAILGFAFGYTIAEMLNCAKKQNICGTVKNGTLSIVSLLLTIILIIG